MGYLDNSTVTVDAILTEKGREVLAMGGGLNIQYACLVDSGIDYTLYNPDHPTGSANYADAITAGVVTEPVPNSVFFLRNRLVTYNEDVTELPMITFPSGLSYTFGNQCGEGSEFTFVPNVMPNPPGYQGDYIMVISDNQIFDIGGATELTEYNPLITSYIPQLEYFNYGVYKFGASGISLQPFCNNSVARTIYATFIAEDLGLTQGITITVSKNDENTGNQWLNADYVRS